MKSKIVVLRDDSKRLLARAVKIVEASLSTQAFPLRFMFSLKYLTGKIIHDGWLIVEMKSA